MLEPLLSLEHELSRVLRELQVQLLSELLLFVGHVRELDSAVGRFGIGRSRANRAVRALRHDVVRTVAGWTLALAAAIHDVDRNRAHLRLAVVASVDHLRLMAACLRLYLSRAGSRCGVPCSYPTSALLE